MFEIPLEYKILSDIATIWVNYEVIHFDEMPIWFTGINSDYQRIIGSMCFEDEDEDYFRYFHIVISDEDYIKFNNREVSYRKLMELYKTVYILDKTINGKLLRLYKYAIDKIPQDYLPLQDTFFPLKTEIKF